MFNINRDINEKFVNNTRKLCKIHKRKPFLLEPALLVSNAQNE